MDKKPTASQAATILAMLKDAGAAGVPNSELLSVALRFSGVIHILRNQGHLIELQDNGGGLYVYIYKGFKQPKKKISAYEKLFDLVADHDKVTTAQLQSIMLQNNICFTLKAIR